MVKMSYQLFKLSEIPFKTMSFFLKCCYFLSFRVINMHANFQHADELSDTEFYRPKIISFLYVVAIQL